MMTPSTVARHLHLRSSCLNQWKGCTNQKIFELEKHLISLNYGDENAVRSVIEQFSSEVKLDEDSVLNKKSVIDECFSKDSVEEIMKSFEAEANKEGNGWIGPFLKGMKRLSPTALKIALRSVGMETKGFAIYDAIIQLKNELVYYVFTPALVCSILTKTITFKSLINCSQVY